MNMRRSFLICLVLTVSVAGLGLSALMVWTAGGTGLIALPMFAVSASPFVLLMLTVARTRTVAGGGLLLAASLLALAACFSVWFDAFYLRPSSLNVALLWQVPAVVLPAMGLLVWRILRWEHEGDSVSKPVGAKAAIGTALNVKTGDRSGEPDLRASPHRSATHDHSQRNV